MNTRELSIKPGDNGPTVCGGDYTEIVGEDYWEDIDLDNFRACTPEENEVIYKALREGGLRKPGDPGSMIVPGPVGI